jgi:hypothetical protein
VRPVLIWDFAQLVKPSRIPQPPKSNLDGLWNELVGDDAARAYQAIWSMAAISNLKVPLLTARLKPEKSTAVKDEELPNRSTEVLGLLRGIALLERIGNPTARQVLSRLTAGAHDSRATREARRRSRAWSARDHEEPSLELSGIAGTA